MHISQVLFVLYSWLSAIACDEEKTLSTLAKLRSDLLRNYDKNIRPTLHYSNETVITVSLYPMYLQDLDEEKQVLILDAWMDVSWIDEHMVWKPEDYDNIKTLTFDHDELWKPQFLVLWSAPTSSLDPYGRSPMTVSYDGHLIWYPTAVYRTQCALDYTDYPYDQQSCSFNISAISIHGAGLDLYTATKSANLAFFSDTNPKWKLVKSNIEKAEMWYIKDIRYTFVLKRRMPYGGDVEWALSIVALLLTLTMFWMPPEKGKKLTLGLTSLLILFGELLFFTLTSPSSPVAIYTARMIQQAIFAVVSAFVLEIIVLNLTRISEFSPPGLLLDILSGPARRFFCFCPQDPKKTSLQKDWYIIASGFDRILFVLYVIVFVSLKTWV